MEENIRNFDEILGTMVEAGMKVKFSKCRFGVCEVELLGHKVTSE